MSVYPPGVACHALPNAHNHTSCLMSSNLLSIHRIQCFKSLLVCQVTARVLSSAFRPEIPRQVCRMLYQHFISTTILGPCISLSHFLSSSLMGMVQGERSCDAHQDSRLQDFTAKLSMSSFQRALHIEDSPHAGKVDC